MSPLLIYLAISASGAAARGMGMMVAPSDVE